MYLLDTNVCIRILNGSSKAVVERFSRESPQSVRLCSVVKAELNYGARRSRNVEGVLRSLAEFFDPLESLPFDDDSAEEYGAIRAQLEAGGTPIGGNDLLIAAIARRHDATLVTHDGDFLRVVGLRIEDWSRS